MFDILTLTGLDANVDLDRVEALSQEFPFLEWGVLLTDTGRGVGRYPDLSTVERFAQASVARRARFALHVCKGAVEDVLQGRGVVAELAAQFPRVQLNSVFPKDRLASLRAFVRGCQSQTLIVQHNTANFNVWPVMSDLPNFAVLFDASKGRGRAPRQWPCAIRQVHCGYAGGLGPQTLGDELPKIARASHEQAAWVDMETHLRTEGDRFDLERARACAQVFRDFQR
jgi:hypothetical protein